MLPLAFLAAALGTNLPPAITVHLCCFRNHDGHVRVGIYNSADAWLKAGKFVTEQVVSLKDNKLELAFGSLPRGRYAVAALHDENDNAKLDMAWLPIPHPAEGVGVSNNAKGTLGPPKFDAAAFDFSGDVPLSLDITVVY